jgi:hypothetical protein
MHTRTHVSIAAGDVDADDLISTLAAMATKGDEDDGNGVGGAKRKSNADIRMNMNSMSDSDVNGDDDDEDDHVGIAFPPARQQFALVTSHQAITIIMHTELTTRARSPCNFPFPNHAIFLTMHLSVRLDRF